MNQRSSQPGRGSQHEKPRIVIKPSPVSDVELHKVKNAWKPAIPTLTKKEVEDTEDDKDIACLLKNVRGILNKLTPQKYEKLLDQIKTLKIDTEEKLKRVIELIFEKAVDEPAFCIQYANLCKHLASLKVTKIEADTEKEVKLTNLLLSTCQKEFEKENIYEGIDVEGRLKGIGECSDGEKKKLLLTELDEEKRRARKRSLGNTK